MAEELMADMGRYVIGHNPAILVALGLGSCIGCAIWDKENHIGGMAHVMLPESRECMKGNEGLNMNKFADIAIPAMIDEMKQKGCSVERMTAKIAGGAHMFKGFMESETMDIGKRNDAAVREELKKLGIPLLAHETGGGIGRTVRFDTSTGKMSIKTKDEVKEI